MQNFARVFGVILLAGLGLGAQSNVFKNQCLDAKAAIQKLRSRTPAPKVKLLMGARSDSNGKLLAPGMDGEECIIMAQATGVNVSGPFLHGDFKDLDDLEFMAEVLKGTVNVILMDGRVEDLRSWETTHFKAVHKLLAPGGFLYIPLRPVFLEKGSTLAGQGAEAKLGQNLMSEDSSPIPLYIRCPANWQAGFTAKQRMDAQQAFWTRHLQNSAMAPVAGLFSTSQATVVSLNHEKSNPGEGEAFPHYIFKK